MILYQSRAVSPRMACLAFLQCVQVTLSSSIECSCGGVPNDEPSAYVLYQLFIFNSHLTLDAFETSAGNAACVSVAAHLFQ